MSGSATYQSCSRCTAKWFGPVSRDQCPRCKAATLPAVQVTPPFHRPGDSPQTAAELLAAVCSERRFGCLSEALGQLPPWSSTNVAMLRRQIESDFPWALESDWWPRVPLALQQPRRSTIRLLELVSREPLHRHLLTLVQHLRQRCGDPRLLSVHRVYRFVVRLLRHGDRSHSPRMDPDGWVAVEDLLRQINRRALNFELWRDWCSTDLRRQLDLHGGRRLQLGNDCDFIRARYGHSVPDIVAGTRQSPPKTLYHGTSADLADRILQHGLQRRERNLVHLTSSLDYAAWIASPLDESVVLQVNTDTATSAAVPFWQCNDHVWQCTDLPATALQIVRADNLSPDQKGRR